MISKHGLALETAEKYHDPAAAFHLLYLFMRLSPTIELSFSSDMVNVLPWIHTPRGSQKQKELTFRCHFLLEKLI